LSLAGLEPKQKADILKQYVKLTRFSTALGTVGFVVCFALVVLRPAGNPPPPRPSDTRSPDDLQVIGIKYEIMALRGNVEALRGGRGSLKDREEGLSLAKGMLGVSDAHLHLTRSIMQHEYAGFAFLIVANTFAESPQSEGGRRDRIRFAQAAIDECDRALATMEPIRQAFLDGKADSRTMHDWMTQESGDLYRTHLLKAMAMAAIAEEKGGYGTKDVERELREVPQTFLAENHAETNSDLKEVLGRSPVAAP
jgi:hypothetical protein